MKPLLLIAAVMLTGCVTLPEVNSTGEVVWQTLHAADVAQTIRGAVQDPCYAEGDPLTRRLIGSKPSTAGVMVWGLGLGALHYGVHRLLEDRAPAWVDTAFEAVSVAGQASIDYHNYSIGVRIGAPNRDDPNCHQHGDVYLHQPSRK